MLRNTKIGTPTPFRWLLLAFALLLPLTPALAAPFDGVWTGTSTADTPECGTDSYDVIVHIEDSWLTGSASFAGEIGIPIVKFRNFRSKWQGVTEANLEKVLNILKAMAPVGVMIDEADAFLGDRNQEGDSGTSNRIFAQITSFMGNTEYRGKIIWFLITCRPDLLPIDLKRQGRAEEHLALFYPETIEEKQELFQTLVRKLKLKVQSVDIIELFKKYKFDFSGADLESILIRAKLLAAMNNHVIISAGANATILRSALIGPEVRHLGDAEHVVLHADL